MNEQQQRDIMTKSIDVLTNFLGKRPRGWTAPAWNTSKQSIRVLEEFGIVSQDTHSPRLTPFTKMLIMNHHRRSTTILSCTMIASHTMFQMAKKNGKKPTPRRKRQPGCSP